MPKMARPLKEYQSLLQAPWQFQHAASFRPIIHAGNGFRILSNGLNQKACSIPSHVLRHPLLNAIPCLYSQLLLTTEKARLAGTQYEYYHRAELFLNLDLNILTIN